MLRCFSISMFCSCILPLSTTVSTSTAETLTALINQNLNDANVLSGNLPVKLLSGCSFTDVFYFELIQFNVILLNIKLFNLIQFNAILLNIKLFNFIQLIFGLNKHCEHCHCFHQTSNKSVSLWRKSIIRIKRFIDVSLIQNELHLNKSHTNTGLFLTTLNISSRHTHTHTHTHTADSVQTNSPLYPLMWSQDWRDQRILKPAHLLLRVNREVEVGSAPNLNHQGGI